MQNEVLILIFTNAFSLVANIIQFFSQSSCNKVKICYSEVITHKPYENTQENDIEYNFGEIYENNDNSKLPKTKIKIPKKKKLSSPTKIITRIRSQSY
jgi:hypothetical protein